MPRRPILAVAACVLLAGCGAPHGTQTLGHESDLAQPVDSLQRLHNTTADDLQHLTRMCPALDGAIGNEVPDAWTTNGIDDLHCFWAFGFPTTAKEDAQLLVGTINGGTYRFHETARLLDDEHAVPGVGDAALYDPQSRALFAMRDGRLWYVQLVGPWPPRYPPERVTTAIARALLREQS